jgi:hypothetical protein
MPFKFAALLYCVVVLTPLAAGAQQHTSGLSPANPGVAVPAVKYESVFTGYAPFRDEKLAPWREVNDEAARIGGHLGIFGGTAGHAGHGSAKPTVQPPAPATKPPAPAAPQMMHGGSHGEMKK